ncbi:unnamed protein product [Nippostrongylus brasiliensis]|uniref:AB hydrolase-1 domain-containing protein n=1 Tax=Nippostrongylus brasiliensis TaxID=27835 RepID=A0A0N4YJM0_NIPBR|nr:unnamed protein product [Nippostrongylus brasiliensis]
MLQDHNVFYRESLPPDSHYAKATIVFLHGQAYTSLTWTDRGSLRTFAALGYHCIAPDLPGSGQTRGPAVSLHDKPQFLLSFLSALGVKQYVLPLLAQDVFVCAVGDYDTSLGPTAAANLRVLPNARLHKIPNAGHACHLNNPQAFEEICMNFFDLVRNYHAL